jgi:peroxiredoxin
VKNRAIIAWAVLAGACLLAPPISRAQQPKIVWSEEEKPILQQIQTLRSLPDDVRARTTAQLALQIRQLPAGANKLALANDLANLSTEGDFGRDTLQEVTTTLAQSLQEYPVPETKGRPAAQYVELAQLVRYEHMQALSDSPEFAAAMAQLEAADRTRQQADFTLKDLQGQDWTLSNLRGKVVVVNFWATWCPPCRKEMPDLESLYLQFKDQGLIVLAISDEGADKVKAFLSGRNVTYPVLLDPGRKVNDLYQVEGIPKTFIYNRDGKLVAQSIDMRTRKQFLEMLAEAGLR